jgi:hypothetical protein
MDKTALKKGYLMTSATLLPAFVGVAVHRMYHKNTKLGMSDLLIFAGLSVLGGFISAPIIKNVKFKDSELNESTV